MTLQEIQNDFKAQLESTGNKLQKLQQETQEQQQLFLKLQGAVEALQLYEDSQTTQAPDFVEPIESSEELAQSKYPKSRK